MAPIMACSSTASSSRAAGPGAALPGCDAGDTPSGETIQAELAATAAERARGLMFRPVLDAAKGMLFLFDTSNIYLFWMLNTLVPLDILWMNEDREVQFISADTPPCQTQVCPTYGPNIASRYVLELAAGEAQRRGLAEGDVLQW
ncbi:MAG: DUF192 domain-containing protein [Bryobacterales bacterium]